MTHCGFKWPSVRQSEEHEISYWVSDLLKCTVVAFLGQEDLLWVVLSKGTCLCLFFPSVLSASPLFFWLLNLWFPTARSFRGLYLCISKAAACGARNCSRGWMPLCFSQLLKKKEQRVPRSSLSHELWQWPVLQGGTGRAHGRRSRRLLASNKPFLPQTGTEGLHLICSSPAEAPSGFSGTAITPLRALFQTQCLWHCVSIGGFYCGNIWSSV